VRKLLWFTLGFGAACAGCAYYHTLNQLILPMLVLALILVLLSGKLPLQKAALLVLGISAGIFWFSGFEEQVLQPVYELDGTTKETVIRCHSFPEKTDYGYRVEGTLRIGERNYTAMCYVDHGEALVPGSVLSGPFRFRVTAPGGLKESAYYQGEGIFLLAYQEDEVTVDDSGHSWKESPARLRQRILQAIEENMPEETAAFSKALLLGDTTALDYQTKTDFTVSGIRHIVAVSGLHVSILFSLLNLLSFRKRILSSLIGFPALLLFAAMTGFTPSVSRACIMAALMLTASLFNREYDGPTALSFAGLILLLINPLVITSVSYQLSFASVAGIFLFSPGIGNWIQSFFDLQKVSKVKLRLVGWFSRSVSVTFGATVMTLPLCALHFGTISLAAVLTNLLVLWIISLIFYGLVLLCLLSSVWAAGAVVLGKLLSILIRYVLLTARLIADFPLAAVYTRSPYIVAWLILVYVLLCGFLVGKNRKPLTFGCCAVIGLCIALVLSWAEPFMDQTRFTVLDVGQGQCLLLQSEGKTYMVDCGGSSDTLAADVASETLLSQGIFKLDALILTHYDRDHAGGVENLLSRIDAKILILPPEYQEQEFLAEKIVYAYEDILLSSGNHGIRIYSSESGGKDNENSLCILFDTENCDILITGDRNFSGERMLLQHASVPDVDVLVAGHHGSKYATCEDLLAAVSPEIVCISAGRENPFGHPAPELLERLQNFGCTIYRTDLHGDILIRR